MFEDISGRSLVHFTSVNQKGASQMQQTCLICLILDNLRNYVTIRSTVFCFLRSLLHIPMLATFGRMAPFSAVQILNYPSYVCNFSLLEDHLVNIQLD